MKILNSAKCLIVASMPTARGRALLGIATVVLLGSITVQKGFAAEKSIGKHSKDEIRKACIAAGGELLGVSDLGSYGCEVASQGTMILCNKKQECTGYTPARTNQDRKRILASLQLNSKTNSK